jgi:HD-GYP domain-containing protein (c-di-GMP phosphodiesterase class II)
VRLAEAVGLDEATIRSLMKGAFLHDVGKIGITDAILLKPGRLTEAEFAEMKKHVSHGQDIISGSPWLQDAKPVVGGHHEKYDGTGYGNRLQGSDIAVIARIFAIADVFDALTSRRPYKEPLGYEETMEILLEGRTRHFDPDLIDTFLRIARPLYEAYSNRDDAKPREDVAALVRRYFKADVAHFLE